MANREAIAAVLLADVYVVGFSKDKTPAQNLVLMTKNTLNAVKRSIETEDLLTIIVATDVAAMIPSDLDVYKALIFPVFERTSISRLTDPTEDHRTPSGGIEAVQQIFAAANTAGRLNATIAAYDLFIMESTTVNLLTNLGRVNAGEMQEAMDYAVTDLGWAV